MTLKGLSEITGYSVITISRAVNNPEKLKKETLKVIQNAIDEYGYTPNNLARALVYNKTNIIYLYMPSDLESTHPFVMQLISGVGSYTGENGYSVLLKRSWYAKEPCDGIILVGLSIEDDKKLYDLKKEKPFMLFGHNKLLDSVDVDNYLGSKMMAEYVISRGYKDIAYMGINQKKRFTQDRLNGHLDGMKEAELDASKIYLIDNNENESYLKGLEILSQDNRPECIVCASDYIAIGMIRAAHQLGIKVPDELGVTGFDGLGFENLITPQITTVRQPIYDVGRKLAQHLLRKIQTNNQEQIEEYYKPDIIVNQSIK